MWIKNFSTVLITFLFCSSSDVREKESTNLLKQYFRLQASHLQFQRYIFFYFCYQFAMRNSLTILMYRDAPLKSMLSSQKARYSGLMSWEESAKDNDLVFCRKTCKFIRSRRPSNGRRSIRWRQVNTQTTMYIKNI